MATYFRLLPLRWTLPIFQLSVCLLALWPMRGFLIFEVLRSIESHTPAKATSESGTITEIVLAPMTKGQQEAADKAAKVDFLRMRVPVVLNFPVVLAQLPYIVASPNKREWTPGGMLPEEWRAMTWPFAGILFWWCAGRGMEALQATRRSVVAPRLTWVETALAVVLFLVGLATLVGIATSTPDDRHDIQFLAFVAGALLWGIFGAIVVAARLLQRRILKRNRQLA
jgi:hypothetical protein